jgi:hypothetical protein
MNAERRERGRAVFETPRRQTRDLNKERLLPKLTEQLIQGAIEHRGEDLQSYGEICRDLVASYTTKRRLRSPEDDEDLLVSVINDGLEHLQEIGDVSPAELFSFIDDAANRYSQQEFRLQRRNRPLKVLEANPSRRAGKRRDRPRRLEDRFSIPSELISHREECRKVADVWYETKREFRRRNQRYAAICIPLPGAPPLPEPPSEYATRRAPALFRSTFIEQCERRLRLLEPGCDGSTYEEIRDHVRGMAVRGSKRFSRWMRQMEETFGEADESAEAHGKT